MALAFGSARELLPAGSETSAREAWLELRRRGVTASEIASVLGISAQPSRFALWWQKKGVLDDEYDNTRMALGRFLEPFICDQFALSCPEYTVLRCGLSASAQRPWQLATFDRVAVPAGHDEHQHVVPAEAKTWSYVDDQWGPDGSDIIPLHYRCQVMWQMDVLGADYGYVICLFLLTQEIRTYCIAYDADDAEVMRSAAQEFLLSLERNIEPDIDGSASTAHALKSIYSDLDEDDAQLPRSLVIRYRSALRRYDAARSRKELLTNQMRAALGRSRRGVDARTGERVVTRSIYQRKAYTVERATVDQLTPVRPRKAAQAMLHTETNEQAAKVKAEAMRDTEPKAITETRDPATS